MFDITFIFIWEYARLLISKNYKQFIHNVADRLSKKNILYVKAFQAVSLNNNFIDNEINNELLKYTDSAPYNDDDIDDELLFRLTKRFNLQPSGKFEPINSGMISLVYKMMMMDTNEEVIIKIKRKNIGKRLDDAIDKLLFTIYLISYIPYFNTLNIPSVIKKNILLLRNQLDFHEEIKNTIEMSDNCKNLKYIKIPKIYEDATAAFPDAIMMEYIKGTHISKLDESDYEKYAKLVLKFGFVTLINNSVTHGDLHAGNILFIKNMDGASRIGERLESVTLVKDSGSFPEYQIGIIDFGIVIRINEKTTTTFLDVMTALFSETGKSLAKKILDAIIEPRDVFDSIPNEHKENLYIETGKIIDEMVHKSKKANQARIYEIITGFNKYLNNNNLKKYNVYISDDFVKMQMALAMAHGASMCLCKNEYMTFANQVLDDLFHINLLFIDSGETGIRNVSEGFVKDSDKSDLLYEQ